MNTSIFHVIHLKYYYSQVVWMLTLVNVGDIFQLVSGSWCV